MNVEYYRLIYMKIKNILSVSLVAVVVFLSSCGRANDETTAVVDTISSEAVDTDPVDYDFGDKKIDKSKMDSITNHPDEMSPGEAAGALVYLYHSVERASGTSRVIAMRKFMDFYNIVLDNHGDDLRSSIAKVSKKQNINISRIYEEYAAALSHGDEGGASIDDVKVDTIRTVSQDATSVTTVISEEAKITTIGD